MTLNKFFLYKYINVKKIQSYKKQNKIKKQKKMENGCASKVLVVGSKLSYQVFFHFQSCFKFQLLLK